MNIAPRTARAHSFQPLECDIPPGLTIAEYRSQRRDRPRERRRYARPRLASLIRR
jgi:hypothetical protein